MACQAENRRGRKTKMLSKLSHHFKCKASGQRCTPKSFAESKRNSLLLILMKAPLFQEIINEFLTYSDFKEGTKSNKKSRCLAKFLDKNQDYSFRIKTEILRIPEWEKELETWLKIQYCGNGDFNFVMKLLLDLIFEYLGLT